MPMKLQLAKPADGREGAKIFVELQSDNGVFKHALRLRQDSKGNWYPEVSVNLEGCSGTNIQAVRTAIAEALTEAARIISSSECAGLQDIAGMVSVNNNTKV